MKAVRLMLFAAFFVLYVFAPPSAARAADSSAVLISGVYYDPFVTGEASEAVRLQNINVLPASLAGWVLSDGEGSVTFPAGATLDPGQSIWIANAAPAFSSEFGFLPDFEYGGNFDVTVPDLSGTAPSMANGGDQVLVKNDSGLVVDAVVYGSALLGAPAWSGTAVQPYDSGNTSIEGQILYRKRQESDGMPFPDSDTAADWAQDAADSYAGKKVMYPGWDLDQFLQTTKSTSAATLKYCVGPDHLYTCMRDEILAAGQSISMEIYSLDSASMVDALLETLSRGVQLTILLDGAAMEDQGKWACSEIEAHGGQCWLMASKPQANIHKRYDSQHGKWLVIDHARALIGSENMGVDAMPADKKKDGTFGTRGGYIISDDPALVTAAQAILDDDLDPSHHADVRRWGTNTDDFPPFGFVPDYDDGGKSYPVQFPTPFEMTGAFPTELVQCPENCLRASDGLLGMVARAGPGDLLYVEMLYEYLYWGKGTSNSSADPNLRLEAYIEAARRGARVRILLDSFFDVFGDLRSNYETCAYVNRLQARYDIACRLGNPTGKGIHIKLVLLEQAGTGFVHLGSINGSETSNKLNREVAVQVESGQALGYWKEIFLYDWASTDFAPHKLYIPLLWRKFP